MLPELGVVASVAAVGLALALALARSTAAGGSASREARRVEGAVERAAASLLHRLWIRAALAVAGVGGLLAVHRLLCSPAPRSALVTIELGLGAGAAIGAGASTLPLRLLLPAAPRLARLLVTGLAPALELALRAGLCSALALDTAVALAATGLLAATGGLAPDAGPGAVALQTSAALALGAVLAAATTGIGGAAQAAGASAGAAVSGLTAADARSPGFVASFVAELVGRGGRRAAASAALALLAAAVLLRDTGGPAAPSLVVLARAASVFGTLAALAAARADEPDRGPAAALRAVLVSSVVGLAALGGGAAWLVGARAGGAATIAAAAGLAAGLAVAAAGALGAARPPRGLPAFDAITRGHAAFGLASGACALALLGVAWAGTRPGGDPALALVAALCGYQLPHFPLLGGALVAPLALAAEAQPESPLSALPEGARRVARLADAGRLAAGAWELHTTFLAGAAAVALLRGARSAPSLGVPEAAAALAIVASSALAAHLALRPARAAIRAMTAEVERQLRVFPRGGAGAPELPAGFTPSYRSVIDQGERAAAAGAELAPGIAAGVIAALGIALGMLYTGARPVGEGVTVSVILAAVSGLGVSTTLGGAGGAPLSVHRAGPPGPAPVAPSPADPGVGLAVALAESAAAALPLLVGTLAAATLTFVFP